MQKRCPRCGETCLDAFGKSVARKGGLQLYCRPCANAKAAEYRKRDPKANKAASAAWRLANPDYAKRKNAEFYAANPEEQKARAQAWRVANPQRHAAATKAWREANAARFKQIHKDWRAANPEHVMAKRRRNYQESRDRELSKAREWKAANPDACRALAGKRMAAKFRAIPRWANLRKIEQIYADCRTVTNCSGELHHVDHIVPLQGKTVCGLHCEANLQIIPACANQSKGNRHWPGQPQSEAIRP